MAANEKIPLKIKRINANCLSASDLKKKAEILAMMAIIGMMIGR
jgi:hypothetical protein